MRRISLALGLALVLMAGAAWGQGRGRPANESFRVSWEPRTTGVISTIQGNVRNDSAVWVTDVRLQVEGLDGYTDSRGMTLYNAALSQNRAVAVRDALIQSGVRADGIDIGTFGTDRARCDESIVQCRLRDGRVEVLIRPTG